MAENSLKAFLVTATVLVILCFYIACNLLYVRNNIALTLDKVRSLEEQVSLLAVDGAEGAKKHGVATKEHGVATKEHGVTTEEHSVATEERGVATDGTHVQEESELSRLYDDATDEQQIIRLKRSDDTPQKKEKTPRKKKAKGARRKGKKEKDKGRRKKRKKTKRYPVQPAASFRLDGYQDTHQHYRTNIQEYKNSDEDASSGWSAPFWVRDTGDPRLTKISTGEIQVERGGLYFLYSMVTFTLKEVKVCDTSMQFGFGIFAIDNQKSPTFDTKVLRCKTPQSCRMEERISCYAGRMVRLEDQKILRLLIQSEISHDTLVIPDPQGTYIGLIYLDL